jgi:(S)-ureidoglycine aminohydrolase
MHKLGHTRSANSRDHLLHTPDTFIRIPLPSLEGGVAVVHTSPAGGAGFTQYTVEMEAGGRLGPTSNQRFVYLLEGSAKIVLHQVTNVEEPGFQVTKNVTHSLVPGSYAYLPEDLDASLTALEPSRIAILEKSYEPHPTLPPPPPFFGHESDAPASPLNGDPDLEVRTLLPDSPAHDFAVNTMTYQPGAALPMVEVHVMEHGLLMLAGGGIYRLGDQWYPVTAGDFIWMAPYCPQWFGAIGKQPAKYLIYKDFNRHPLSW